MGKPCCNAELRRAIAERRPDRQPPEDPVVRSETEPGQPIQSDFTVIRRGLNPLLAFVATQGFRLSGLWS